ncbi:MAG: acetyl-CoA carboxylase biotin carboxyl carrier protein [bacterium]
MNDAYIKKLIKLVEDSKIESLEVSSWGRKVRIVQRLGASTNGHNSLQPIINEFTPQAPPAAAVRQAAPPPTPAPEADDIGNLIPIKSPMVGTFYAAPAPDADPYVALNQKIIVGQVVCIVEAMKLMNEIESEVSGRIAKTLVQNAEPVEFGQTLFLIEPD